MYCVTASGILIVLLAFMAVNCVMIWPQSFDWREARRSTLSVKPL